MIKIVFLDFDSTLYSHTLKTIPSSSINSLKKLQDNGVKLFLSTGRSLEELKQFDMNGFEYDGIVSLNGQIIYDKNDKVILSKPIKGILKEKLIELFNNKKIPTAITYLDGMYINFINDVVKRTFKEIDTTYPRIAPIIKNEDFFMASLFIENSEKSNIINSFCNISNVTYWSNNGVDIVDKSVSKASGVEEVLKLYNIKKEESISFGDGQNDIEMMSATGISIAMGNACKEVKEKATYITNDIDDNGIENAINKYNTLFFK